MVDRQELLATYRRARDAYDHAKVVRDALEYEFAEPTEKMDADVGILIALKDLHAAQVALMAAR